MAVATVLAAAASPSALAAETIVIDNILVDQNDPSANYNDPQNDYQIKFNGAKMDPASISVEGNQLDATINSLLISDSDVNFNWTSNILYGIKGTANSTINITTNDITFKSYDSKARNLYGFHANNSRLNLNAKIYLQELLRESLQAEQAQNLRHSETLQEQAERVQQQQSQRISTTL